MNRYHSKGYKNPQQQRKIAIEMKKKQRPVISFVSDAEAKNQFAKARIELLNNIPLKGDSKEVITRKKTRYDQLTKVLARFNQI